MIEGATRSSAPLGVSRRSILLGGLGVAATGTVVGLAEPVRRSALAAQIRSFFPYLSFDDTCIDRFITEFEAHAHVLRRNPFKLWNRLPEHVFADFLMSTNFFPDEDESKPLEFVSLYSSVYTPASACINPLSLRYGG